jgi:uncharacterized protein YqjF (DUF2071 family)
MTRPFVEAHLVNLAFFTYQVPDDLLKPYLPRGCVLDKFRGATCATLVALDFEETRVAGWRVPMHVEFPQVSLQFYVRHDGRRGVCFIREFAPRLAVSFVAGRVFNEPCVTSAMTTMTERTDTEQRFSRSFRAGDQVHRLVAAVSPDLPTLPRPESEETWIKEHEWVFGSNREGRSIIYRVAHPQWLIWKVNWYSVSVDFGAAFGDKWRFLSKEAASHVMVAEGSAVKIYQPKVIG